MARLEADDVRFRHLSLHQHGAEIRQRQNVRCLLRGYHRLALQRGDLHHVTVHRCFYTGKRQIDLGSIQAGLIPGDLRLNGTHLRLLHRQLCRRLIQILA
ncbi:hypothetical protein D3C72_2096440 [compost metagenome]